MLAGMGAIGTLCAARQCGQSAFLKGILQIFDQIKSAYTLEPRSLALNASAKGILTRVHEETHVTMFSAAFPVVCWLGFRFGLGLGLWYGHHRQ